MCDKSTYNCLAPLLSSTNLSKTGLQIIIWISLCTAEFYKNYANNYANNIVVWMPAELMKAI